MPSNDGERVKPVIGLIGGSGLYDIDGLVDKEWRTVETPVSYTHLTLPTKA